jgi:hypothetical protein
MMGTRSSRFCSDSMVIPVVFRQTPGCIKNVWLKMMAAVQTQLNSRILISCVRSKRPIQGQMLDVMVKRSKAAMISRSLRYRATGGESANDSAHFKTRAPQHIMIAEKTYTSQSPSKLIARYAYSSWANPTTGAAFIWLRLTAPGFRWCDLPLRRRCISLIFRPDRCPA